MYAFAAVLLIAVGYSFAETLVRRRRVSSVMARSLMQPLVGIAAAGLFIESGERTIAAVFLALSVIAGLLRGTGRLLISDEQSDGYGIATLFLGLGLAAMFASGSQLFALAALMVGVVDPAGTVVGRNIGKIHIPFGRSLEGTAAVFAVAFAVFTIMSGDSAAHALGFASAIAVTELVSVRGVDKLTLPLVALIAFSSLGAELYY